MDSVLNFSQKVWRLTAQIPRGRVATYGELARVLGRPGAARAVGNALNKNPDASRVPCHRVVRGNGQIGGYAWGSPAKAKILRQEGVRISPKNKVENFEKICYKFKM
jgi:O-6-methylguanine DNA methyltransferase